MKNDNFDSQDDQKTDLNNIIKFPGAADQLSEDLLPEETPAEQLPASMQAAVNLTTFLEPGKKDSQAKAMVSMASMTATFLHTPDGEAYACIDENGFHKTIKVKSKDAGLWLTRLIYNATETVPNPSSLKTALRTLEAKARFDGPETEVHIKYAAHVGCIYIDLVNEKCEQVEISHEGRRVISAKDSPVKFRRERGMASMCHPAENGSLDPLRDILNLESEADFKLIVGWLIGAMIPGGPFPIMTMVGEQGSSKSTTARLLKQLTDPASIDLVALPKSERDLAIAARKTWTLPYDNLSKLSDGLSDAFCRLSTGGGFRTRTLYTDESEILFTSTRPVIMNGIADFIARQDLADRAIIINLPQIPRHKRLTEKQLTERWAAAKPLIFGALCDALSMSLRNIGKVSLPEYPRMADFAQLVAAAEPALPWKQGEFFKAYSENIKKVIDIALESDKVAVAVMALIDGSENREWTGKATDLKVVLDSIVEDRVRRLKSWPKQANALSGRINRCSTFLRSKGIEIERGKSGDRYISIQRSDGGTVHTAPTVQEKQHPP
jgi:hypothetical protein